jgi:hypothetical protein
MAQTADTVSAGLSQSTFEANRLSLPTATSNCNQAATAAKLAGTGEQGNENRLAGYLRMHNGIHDTMELLPWISLDLDDDGKPCLRYRLSVQLVILGPHLDLLPSNFLPFFQSVFFF